MAGEVQQGYSEAADKLVLAHRQLLTARHAVTFRTKPPHIPSRERNEMFSSSELSR